MFQPSVIACGFVCGLAAKYRKRSVPQLAPRHRVLLRQYAVYAIKYAIVASLVAGVTEAYAGDQKLASIIGCATSLCGTAVLLFSGYHLRSRYGIAHIAL